MFLYRPEVPTAVENPLARHPHIQKDVHENKMKYAHNSINNPRYPRKDETDSIVDRTKFTIIGDRVTREFTYCANLVKGLHKYRKKIFEAPEIRGVTTVEWPMVLNDLKIRFSGLAFCLSSSVAVLINGQFLGGEKELKELIEAKYTYHLSLDYYKEGVAEFAKFVDGSGRPCAYMNIAIGDKHAGTLIFMLYSDIVPRTCDNFLRLCNEKKGGYSGTPIHRVVKDGWIQGGGFGLKNTPFDCENFLVPHDRRGVLCMANDGRHVDCSTQFFVLLQPAPWMVGKYVAFGQLIEGKGTLEKIKAVPTWYEAPTSPIVICEAGIFNMQCRYVMINKGTNEYIDGHIEDLNALGELLIENLLAKVFLTAELREIELLKEVEGEGAESVEEDDGVASVRETQRFNRKKEDIEKQIQIDKIDTRHGLPSVTQHPQSSADNKEFDAETYDPEYEIEETDYVHQSIYSSSLVVKPQKPYYVPLTDTPYPGEKDSDFNLRRFLQGDYCLEDDLEAERKPFVCHQEMASYPSDLFDFDESESDSEEDEDMDSEDEREIQKYLKINSDRVSFAGGVVKKIARAFARSDLHKWTRKSELLTDEQLRRLRIASMDLKSREHHDKKVSMCVDASEHHSKIKRRQTGFVRPEDLAKIRMFRKDSTDDDDDDDDYDDDYNDDDDDEDDDGGNRKVRIDDAAIGPGHGIASGRRPTGYVRPGDYNIDDDDDDDDDDNGDVETRQSVLVRLFDDVKAEGEAPTLKDYKPLSEVNQKNIVLKFSSNYRIKSDESTKEKYVRQSLTKEESYEHVLNLQHGKKVSRKISSDYVKTIDQMEHRLENSIRSVEFAKKRPAMSVAEYQMKNKKYYEEQKNHDDLKEGVKAALDSGNRFDERPSQSGLRLPGDSPLYSVVDVMEIFLQSQQIKT